MALPSTLANCEAHYSFRFSPVFIEFYRFLQGRPEAQQFGSGYRILEAHEIASYKSGVAPPDLLPIMVSDEGDAFCLRMPRDGSKCDDIWVLYEHETNGIVSYGSSLAGMAVGILLELHGLWHRSEVDRPGQPQRERIKELALTIWRAVPEHTQEHDLLRTVASESALARAWDASPCGFLLGRALSPLRIPLLLGDEGRRESIAGNTRSAESKWSAALLEDSCIGAVHFGLGDLYAANNDVHSACSHFAAVVEGNWCTNELRGICAHPHLTADVSVAAAYLSEHLDVYRQVTQSVHVYDILARAQFGDENAWVRAIAQSCHDNDYDNASAIAHSGLCQDTWHPGNKFQVCCNFSSGNLQGMGSRK